MKNTKWGKVSIFLVSLVIASSSLLAHSGRTDSSGGHKDNKNKSGLGSYHYHCGGNPPHLHSKGVCPYKSSSSSSNSSSSSSSSSSNSSASTTNSKPTYNEKEQAFVIDGESITINTITVNNTNLVELKTLCEKLGLSTSYDSSTKSIDCKKGNTAFTLQIDSTNFWLNNNLSTLNVAPIAYNGRTMIPARVVAEAVGKTVTFDSVKNQIAIQ